MASDGKRPPRELQGCTCFSWPTQLTSALAIYWLPISMVSGIACQICTCGIITQVEWYFTGCDSTFGSHLNEGFAFLAPMEGPSHSQNVLWF
ncbi:hypothetical protein BDW66DRAFT_70121 [Aspergillus desertorum]